MNHSNHIIAVAGGSGSGKTTLTRKLLKYFESEGSVILGQDNYYIDQSAKFDRDGGAVNFDHPASLDFSLLANHLNLLRQGQSIPLPVYDFASHKRLERAEKLLPQPYLFLDGILILSQENVRSLCDVSIFLEVDETTRFQRRLKRDIEERGRTPEGVKEQFYRQVKAMHDEFVEPSKVHSNFLVRDREIIVQRQENTEVFEKMRNALLAVI